MLRRTRKLPLLVALALACLAATAVAATVVYYSNQFASSSDVAELNSIFVPGVGNHCKKSLGTKQLVVTVGKATTECDFAPPLIAPSGGGNLGIGAKVTLTTTSKLAKKTFLSIGLRANTDGTGGKYRLDLLPAIQRFALRRYENNEKAGDVPGVRIIAQAKKSFILGVGKANSLFLGAWKDAAGTTHIYAKINGHVVANTTDPAPLTGRRMLISIGRASGADLGGQGTFKSLSIRSMGPVS